MYLLALRISIVSISYSISISQEYCVHEYKTTRNYIDIMIIIITTKVFLLIIKRGEGETDIKMNSLQT